MARDRSSEHRRGRRAATLGGCVLLAATGVIGTVAGSPASAGSGATGTYTISPTSGPTRGSAPVYVYGPNVAEAVFVYIGNFALQPNPLQQDVASVYTPGNRPAGNVEVRIDFGPGDDAVVAGGYTYVEQAEPGSTEPPLVDTGTSSSQVALLAAGLVGGGGAALLLSRSSGRRRSTDPTSTP